MIAGAVRLLALCLVCAFPVLEAAPFPRVQLPPRISPIHPALLDGAINSESKAPPAKVSGPDVPPEPAPADNPQATERRRIVPRPMRPGMGVKLTRVPLLPLIGLGKGMEKGLIWIEENRIDERLTYYQEWLREHHLEILTGGMGPGAGFAFGVRVFDDRFLHPRIRWEMPLRYSTNSYVQAETALGFSLAGERLVFLDLFAQYRSRPQEDFFGLGPGSLETDRTNFKLQDRSAGAAIGTEWNGFRFDFSVRLTNARVFRGEDRRFPATGVVFPGLIGLAGGSSVVRYGPSATFSLVDSESDPHAGIRAAARFLWVNSLRADDFRFYDFGAELNAYTPLGETRTLFVRVTGDFRQPRRGGEIPFYELPHLGGARTMRGFREFRFRDRSALLVTAEYRYEIRHRMDFVIFLDSGQVAPRARDFRFGGFRESYGAGLRVKARDGATTMRLDVGASAEGVRFYWTFSGDYP